jgi:hypothetical protein
MAKQGYLSLLFLVLVTLPSYAQEAIFGAKTGFNLAILCGTVNRDPQFKPGAHIGGFVELPFLENVKLQPELIYSSQGARTFYGSPSAKTGETNLNLHYLILPVVLKIYAGPIFNFQFGPQLGILLGAREKGTVSGIDLEENVTEAFKTLDFSFTAGAGIDISEVVDFGARVNYGVSNIGQGSSVLGDDDRPLNNRVIHVFVGFSF